MTSPPRIPPALEAAAASLRSRYADRHPVDVVERTLLDAYQRLAAHARVQDFVPIFAERTARQRLEFGRRGRARGRGPAGGAPPRRAPPPEDRRRRLRVSRRRPHRRYLSASDWASVVDSGRNPRVVTVPVWTVSVRM